MTHILLCSSVQQDVEDDAQLQERSTMITATSDSDLAENCVENCVEDDPLTEETAEHTPTTHVSLVPRVSREYLLHHGVCPTRWTAAGTLVIAARPDAFREALDDLALAYGSPVVAEEAS